LANQKIETSRQKTLPAKQQQEKPKMKLKTAKNKSFEKGINFS